MDEKYLEMAGDFAARIIESGIERSRKSATMPIDFDGHCSCGEEIPKIRIDHGYFNCVDCQTAIERAGKHLR